MGEPTYFSPPRGGRVRVGVGMNNTQQKLIDNIRHFNQELDMNF
jgi:hypothetical protein